MRHTVPTVGLVPYSFFCPKEFRYLCTMRYADIILPLPLEGTFTYSIPSPLREKVECGMRVIVPVGKTKRYIGIVAAMHDTEPAFTCRNIEQVLDSVPFVLPQQLELWQWMADYYLCPLGDIYKAALPGSLRSLERLRQKTERWVRLSDNIREESDLHAALDAQRRAPLRKRLLEAFIHLTDIGSDTFPLQKQSDTYTVSVDVLLNDANATTTALNNLVKQGILVIYEKAVKAQAPLIEHMPTQSPHPLTSTQQETLKQIRHLHGTKRVVLLRGVTSSGKTEIYIHLIEETLRRGGQVLYLLPEIALTVQITDRLRSIFGNRLGVYHSRYSDTERENIWRRQCSEHPYDVIIGARSAVFLPFRHLQLVIIDEEHDANLHQSEPSPRYHARSVAIMLAQFTDPSVKVLLGSATPCAESYRNAQQGKYGYVQLLKRHLDLPLPRTVIVDIKDLSRRKMMRGMFSPVLLEAMHAALAKGRQVIVFRNHRGYAPVFECNDCGWTPHCTQCDTTLTLHRRTNSLTCHTCGRLYTIPAVCPVCKGTHIRTRGYGTEKVEDTLTTLFPQTKILRMDLDNTRTRHAHERLIEQFSRGEAQILVGTQMVTKGFDFDGVDIVAIVDADAMLNIPDFRAAEQGFAMMLQVSGRSGRRREQGQVFLQTKDTGSKVIRQVVDNDYEGFMNDLLEERRAFAYPPFTHLIYIYIRHRDERLAEEASAMMASMLSRQLPMPVLGPDKPSTGRVRQEHIRKIVIKDNGAIPRTQLRQLLRQARTELLNDARFKNVYLYFEVDP